MSTPSTSLSEKFSRQKRPISFSGMKVNQVKTQLAAQLDDKEKILERMGTSQISRNALIKQTDVIRNELIHLNRFDQDEELPMEIQLKLEGLANEFQYLKSSKSMLDESAATGFSPLLPPPPTNSSPSKQRSKPLNGNRRNPDIEFATEIGQGLLIEVRKLQSSLQEKEEIIKNLELSKADNERNNETSQRYLKQREEIEERLKEENWNLEVANQELRAHLSESNQSVAKHNSDYGRLSKQLKSQAEQIDIMKAQEEKSISIMEAMKARHEQETHHLRRHAASAQRDNSQIQKQVEALNTELKIVKAKLAIKLATSSRIQSEEMNQNDSSMDLTEENDSDDQNKSITPPTSTLPGTRSQQVMETETLKQSLAHAHRIISNLRSSYHKEKLEKFEIKKMLSDSQESIEQMRKEMSSWNSNNTVPLTNNGNRSKGSNNKKKTVTTKKKRGGVARQPRGLCPNESDNDSKLEEEEEQEEETEEYDSMDEDNLDQNFTNYGNSFNGILDFNNGTSFSSIPMKPLSSELESKVQVIDAGVNTDPIDTNESWLNEKDDTPESPSTLLVGSSAAVNHDSNTRVSQQVPIQGAYSNNVLQTLPDSLNKQLNRSNNVLPINTNILINQDYVQDQVTKAVVKERLDISERAASFLSPEQIQLLIPSPLDQLHLTPNEIMIPQNQVDQLIHIALEKEKVNMVPKIEVAKLVEEAVVAEQDKAAALNLIPKAEADKLVEEAVVAEKEKVVALNLIPKAEADKLVEEAVVAEKEKVVALNLIPKAEADKLVEEAVVAEKEKVVALNLIPKAEADKLVEEAVVAEKEKVVALNLIPKTEADKLVEEAVVAEQEKITTMNLIPKVEADKLIEQAIVSEQEKITTLNLIPKVEADKLIEQAIVAEQEKITTLNLIPKVEADKLVEQAIVAEQEKITTLNLIPKTEAEKMMEERVEQVTNQLKKETDSLVQELNAQHKSKEETLLCDMIPKAEAEALSLAAVALASEQVKKQVEITSLKSISLPTEEMITKKEADELIQLATKHEQSKVQQALEKQKAAIETATLLVHKKELEKQKLELDTIKKIKLEQHVAELELIKQEALEKQRQEIEAATRVELEKQKQELEEQKKEIELMKQSELDQQKKEIELLKQTELEEQRKEFELLKQAELEKQKSEIETATQLELEKQKAEIELIKQAELEKQKLDIESMKQAELEKQKADIELIKRAELESQRVELEATARNELEIQKQTLEQQKLELEAAARADYEKQIIELEAKKQSELEQQNAVKLAELTILTKTIENYKKENEETSQRMVTMLTKDSADVLIKRAVSDALEKAEKTQSEVMSGMISREYALVMVKDEVAKALDLERKEVAQREEEESIQMISKAEAEALAKVAAADAIVKERQAMAAREKELVTKEEAEILAASAAREAVDKERNETMAVLARERKMLREKEERLITREESEEKTKEAVRIALIEKESKMVPELTTTSHLNIASNGSRYVDNSNENQQELPSPTLERSVSTSRLALPSLNISPAPSISTPASSSSSRKLRLSNSVSSLRLGNGRKENNVQKNQRPNNNENTTPSSLSFGSFRILENSKYGSRLQSKSSISLRDLSNRQESVASISTLSSDDGHHRTPLPMNSDDSFAGFSNGGTDMYVISSITQTMIGEWMSKHTRRYVGGGISENKHQRFFWVHPYTKILYWSSIRPGAEGNEAKTKSAFIESVSAVPSHDNNRASPMSLLIRTPKRDLKLTAPSLERHDLWFKSLSYLLGRPNEATNQLVEEPRLTTETSALENAGHQHTTLSSKASDRSIPNARDIVNYDSDDSDDLINIRQCCDGKHDLSTLSKGSHHHHHS